MGKRFSLIILIFGIAISLILTYPRKVFGFNPSGQRTYFEKEVILNEPQSSYKFKDERSEDYQEKKELTKIIDLLTSPSVVYSIIILIAILLITCAYLSFGILLILLFKYKR